MKTIIALLTVLLPLVASAAENHDSDRAAALLAEAGRIAVNEAGPYVEVGTFQIQVVVKLGPPDFRRGDTWFYKDYVIPDSAARGVLTVRFANKRVSDLALVTPSVTTAMLRHPSVPENTRLAQSR